MKVLVIGNGGREHALCWKLKRDDPTIELFCAPGNAGTAELGANLPLVASDIPALVAWSVEQQPDLVIVGPVVPLCAGWSNAWASTASAPSVPRETAARIEGSKQFAKRSWLRQRPDRPLAAGRHRRGGPRRPCVSSACPPSSRADGLAAPARAC